MQFRLEEEESDEDDEKVNEKEKESTQKEKEKDSKDKDSKENKDKVDKEKTKSKKGKSKSKDKSAGNESEIILFMEAYLSLLKTVSNQMRNSSQYFYLLCDFARLGVDEVSFDNKDSFLFTKLTFSPFIRNNIYWIDIS